MINTPFYPIVYVRGYAGTQAEVEDTVATPYMGFNLGSTKLRQSWDREIVRYIFESPLIRLMKDHGYADVYSDGDVVEDGCVNPKSIWIYRYYESVSKDLGTGARPEIEDYAEGLYDLIEGIRDHVCGPTGSSNSERDKFRVYLVAHSMGGLVVRCYLQNIYPAKSNGKQPPVDKVFTYATPHGGIDFRLVGNVPAFLQVNNIENFNEDRMKEYLKLSSEPVNSLDGKFDTNRFFSLVGTNYRDYPAAKGLASAAVGPMSDGLVQIKNACVKGSPRAYVHRAHSGNYGIVNSEEGYQSLRRFLFGDVRVDIKLEIDDITLPTALQKEKDKGHEVRASYHAESIVRVRGARWDLHRRLVAESSAHFIPYKRIKEKKPVYLYTGYLLKAARVKRRGPLGFSLDLGILVPEYEVDRKWRVDDYYEGGYIFRDKVNFDLSMNDGSAKLKFGFDSKTPNRAGKVLEATTEGDVTEFQIPVVKRSRPGITATLKICTTPWN